MSAVFQRQDLVSLLSLLKDSLLESPHLPILGHFVFSPNKVAAYNGNQLTVLDLPNADIAGTVHGGTLLSLLNSLTAEDVTLDFDSGKLNVSTKRTKIALPANALAQSIMPTEEVLLDNMEGVVLGEFAPAFFKGLAACGGTVGNNPLFPETLGITITPEAMYSTNNRSISKYNLPFLLDGVVRSVLPTAFCSLAVALYSKLGDSAQPTLYIGHDAAILSLEGAWLQSALLEARDKRIDFEKVVGEFSSEDAVPLPDNFKELMQRAALVLTDTARCEVEFQGAQMRLRTSSDIGVVSDELMVSRRLPAAKVLWDVKSISAALDHVSSFCPVSDQARATVFTGEEYTFLVSNPMITR